MKLNEIKNLTEAAEKNLFGFKINGTEITKDTPNEVWTGYFYCSSNGLKSLEFCPKIVKSHFDCTDNQLKSLEFCHLEVNGYFDCTDNQLKSLEHGPKIVHGNFYCSVNQLKSLEFCPKIVHGNFSCYNNELKSLKSIHKQLHEMNGVLNANRNPIKSHVIGVLLVKGCKGIELNNKKVQDILNKYLPNTSV